jgi:hypothetical protein
MIDTEPLPDPGIPSVRGDVQAQIAMRCGLGTLRRGPRAVALRATLLAAGCVVLAQALAIHDPGVLCPVRRLTGLPCPLCGGTTALAAAGAGDFDNAFAANPLVLLGGLALVAAPAGAGDLWWRFGDRARTWLVLGLLTVAWLYQLVRFHVIN